ncbi:hypothetical protein G7B40_030460 [Aetokthonos hydrillicola Thurmond2011]|uniref:Uncharacterized protein n=1 Tax=Aetokthonos hydrillicola Thurmond2011 TaxID=2712845 RepID=A0AAP5MCW6_9CYAN|nr:hypothetical protein [Aetokthonos hydrillicola Thurmond2011]
MTLKHNKIKFPLWQYLNQPVFTPYIKPILNPRRFAYYYRVQLLQRCWTKECNVNRPYQN